MSMLPFLLLLEVGVGCDYGCLCEEVRHLVCSVEVAEACAILRGIWLARDGGLYPISVESDAAGVVLSRIEASNFLILELLLLSSFPVLDVHYVPSLVNKVSTCFGRACICNFAISGVVLDDPQSQLSFVF
ncbi:hypothetical protein Ddye_020764 [Dipteronia dyeriana]|uniref:RNase H type-1 domain-containing protein n=1 Tax=Dipteronia dyeriana TaxID=168575 RepID=A0AAD9WVN7_9ROSI|nr:hypothetical protein Ddye_020764 [Dipteronia dyeriana]